MIKLILFAVLIPWSSFASDKKISWYFPVGKAGAKTYFSTLAECETKESQECFDISSVDHRFYDVEVKQIDDLSKPIKKAPYNVKACDDISVSGDCSSKMSKESNSYCLAGDYFATSKNSILPGFTYFCTGVAGYEKKTIKMLILNQVKKDQVVAADLSQKNNRDAMDLVYKNMKFGKKIVAMLAVRNASKGLTSLQTKNVVSTYSLVNALLVAGAISTARDEITGLTPDGALLLQADKDALLSEINSYLNP